MAVGALTGRAAIHPVAVCGSPLESEPPTVIGGLRGYRRKSEPSAFAHSTCTGPETHGAAEMYRSGHWSFAGEYVRRVAVFQGVPISQANTS